MKHKKTAKETMKDIVAKLPSLKARGRSPLPPPSQIHRDKRRKTRAQDRVALRSRVQEDFS